MRDESGEDAGPAELLASGRFLDFSRRKGWEFVARRGVNGVVLVVPVTDDGEIVLVEQFRPPVGKKVVELPAGLSGDDEGGKDEPLEMSARRELLEETGYEATAMERLFEGPPSAGVTSEIVTFFLATGLVKRHEGGGVGHEEITAHAVSLGAVEEWLTARERAGSLVDVKVFAGLYFAHRLLASRPGPAHRG
jgi:ADP-ribose pyrophosphatase